MVQTEQSKAAEQGPSKSQTSSAFRVTIFLLGATIIVDLVYIVLAVILNAWQMYVLAGGTFVFGLVTLLGLRLVRAGQSHQAMKLIVGGMLVILPAAGLLIANIGLILSIGLILLVAAIVPQTLPVKQSSWAILAGIVMGGVILLIDEVGPTYRLSVPILQIFLPAVIAVLLLIYLSFIVRQFNSYNLRTKLVLVFLAGTLLIVTLVSLFTIRITNSALTANVGNNLNTTAKLQAQSIESLLARQIAALRSLTASSRTIRNRLFLANASYGTANLAEIEKRLIDLDKQWVGGSNIDPLITSQSNSVVAEIERFRENFPEHSEVFITDQYGGLLAATTPPSDYYQADERWWQETFDNGRGDFFISQPTFDESSQIFGLQIGVPIFDENKTVIGVLRATYGLEDISKVLTSVQLGETGRSEIYLPGGMEYEAGHAELEPAEFTLDLLREPQALSDGYLLADYDEVPSLISHASLADITTNQAISDLGWTILVRQGQQEALAPLTSQRQSIILLAMLIAGLAVVAALGMTQLLIRPVTSLTTIAQHITSGDLTARANIETGDEIGVLAEAFNTMAERVSNMVDTLEERVTGRTRQLETLIQVSQRLSGILDLSDLMRQIVTLIKETFNYYHVHIYLLDEAGETLIMAEGYGEAGAEMKRQVHSIGLQSAKSLVAQSAREGKLVSEANVRDNPDWLPNPLLPETNSEMAVPIKLGNETVGVLDVQSEMVAGFTPEDEATLQALANQIATAIQNARLFSETQDALYQAQRMQRLYTEQAWDKFKAQKDTTFFERRQSAGPSLEHIDTPEASVAVQQRKTVQLKLDDIQTGQKEVNHENALATPLQLGNKVIGVLGIRDENPDRQWTDDEIALIEAVSQQMSLAIENARLFEETQRNAWRDRIVSESTARVWSSTEIEEVMQAAVDQLGNQLGASEVVLRLNTESLDDLATDA